MLSAMRFAMAVMAASNAASSSDADAIWVLSLSTSFSTKALQSFRSAS